MKLKIYFDEAGRGPLAGPVVVGAICPIDTFDSSIFQDSKKLSEKKRENIFEQIQKLEEDKKLLFAFGFATNNEIDNLGISKSINLASKRAIIVIFLKYIHYVENKIHFDGTKLLIIEKLKETINTMYKDTENLNNYDMQQLIKLFSELEKIHGLIFDGNVDFGLSKDLGFKVISIIKGDGKVPFIGGASIVAKVVRDQYMQNIASQFPHYHFEKHKGYGTKLHREAIQKYGACDLHRISFLGNILKNNKK